MKRKNLLKLKAMIFATALAANSITVDAKIQNKGEILNEALDEFIDDDSVIEGRTIYKSDDKPIIKKETKEIVGAMLGDIVTVNGRGFSSTTGNGPKTKEYKNEKMAVVGEKLGNPYPYALVKINDDGSLSDVVGWFKGKNLKSKIRTTTVIKHADVVKEIVQAKPLFLEYHRNDGTFEWSYCIPGVGYQWLGDRHAIAVNYMMSLSTMEKYKCYEYEIINEKTGLSKLYDSERIRIKENEDTLEKVYKIKNIY